VNSVHESWTTTSSLVYHGPCGSADTTPLGHDGALVGGWPPAAPLLESSPAGVGHGEVRVANPFRSSTVREGWRGGWQMMVK
jgi:hypothetical protein